MTFKFMSGARDMEISTIESNKYCHMHTYPIWVGVLLILSDFCYKLWIKWVDKNAQET
jgi:hypothetical protein